MNARKIREDLGRARNCVQRRDLPRAVYLLCLSLRDLGGQTTPMSIRGDFRNVIVDICADPLYKKYYSQPIGYQPGKEKELLAFFSKFYQQLTGIPEAEDYETALQRKLSLDRCINDGKSFLSQGKPTEADECFTEALKFYRDEFAAFSMMAKAMLESGQPARALGYVRRGLKERPKDPGLTAIGMECARLREQTGK